MAENQKKTSEVECELCGGAGWIQTTVDDGPSCPECRGEGVVAVQDEMED